jgi:hypothetical protein
VAEIRLTAYRAVISLREAGCETRASSAKRSSTQEFGWRT